MTHRCTIVVHYRTYIYMKKIKIIEIGIGPHARRVYVPAMRKWGPTFNAEISLVVDLDEQESSVRQYFQKQGYFPDFLFVKRFVGGIPNNISNYLDEYVEKNDIQAVIISTEPTVHYPYAIWALKKGLHILMDKPITARENAVSSLHAAKQIEDDYKALYAHYKDLQKNKSTAFIINTQRRFHPGFNLVTDLLHEVAVKTDCPITSIQSTHCDGQWRLPNEIVTQDYHPYNRGFGKASHSGYHLFDAVYQFYKTSGITGKVANSMEVFSSFVQPKGFLHQLHQKNYESFFGKRYKKVRTLSDRKLSQIFNGYGEIDLSSIVTLKKDDDAICNITLNLLHNGFAKRSWMLPGEDLYKGNGRVKHEYHNIEQGPFQNIQIHSYQSKDKHDVNTEADFEVGGNNHFDIYIFRNYEMTGDKKALRIIRMNDINSSIANDSLVVERVKHSVVKEFLSFLQGSIPKQKLTSNIDDHLIPVQMMSGVYRSHNQYKKGKNPLVKYSLSL